MQKFEIVATKDAKVLSILSECLKGYTHSNFCTALKNKDVIVNGKRTRQNIQVVAGDKIQIFLPNKTFDFDIVFEDQNIIVFNKARKIEVCDGKYNLKQEYQNFFKEEIFAIHRIDAGTSGLVMFAKSKNFRYPYTKNDS